MTNSTTAAQRLGRVLARVTRQSGRMPETSEYGSWLLGRVSERPLRRRIRIQAILTVFLLAANLIGIAVALTLVSVAFPVPSIFDPEVLWITLTVIPAYCAAALVIGVIWVTKGVVDSIRWAIEEIRPTIEDQRNTFLAPWRLTKIHLALWGIGTALLTTLYGMSDAIFIPRFLFAVGFSGIVVSTCCYQFAEFALRPVAAMALEVGRRSPQRFAPGIMGRIMTVWGLGAGVPVLGIVVAATFSLSEVSDMTETQFSAAVLILGIIALVFGFMLMWIVVWLTAAPVRTVRHALRRVEDGDFDTKLVVFDGTELGELQRGFNAMVHGLRERERIRDLFGRHVGHSVARAAETQSVELGGEERHTAVIFVDVIGSTELAVSRSPIEVVKLLNRFFAVIVEEVQSHQGLLNKFEGDATLAIFGAPVSLDAPEDKALAAARAIAYRLLAEVPECPAGIGVTAGRVVAGNVGAKHRFEYTVIGDAVNSAARLSDLSKDAPGRVLASADAVRSASAEEQGHWEFGDEVVLRGRKDPTRLATLKDPPKDA